jgi:GMP synthase (glutamine-hydrolysing)
MPERYSWMILRKGTIAIVKVGSTMPALRAAKGDFEDWVLSAMGIRGDRALVVDVRNGAPLPRVEEMSGVVITGSHEMVTSRLEWSERTASWLAKVVQKGIPALGICYGHQLLAHSLGGTVGDNPQGLEFGTVEVHLGEQAGSDRLLGGLKSPIRVHVSHTQTVLRLPEGATLLASSTRDRHQAFAVGESAWGVQFHPEFDAEVVRAYIEECREELLSQGQSPADLAARTVDTPYGTEILKRFAAFARGRVVASAKLYKQAVVSKERSD